MASRRVVITGIGLISPIGLDRASSWEAVCEGRSGVGPITCFDPTDYACKIAAETTEFDPSKYFEHKEIKKFDRFVHLGVGAADEAVIDSGLVINDENATRVGVVMGSGIGGLPLITRTRDIMNARGPRRISPFFIPGSIINMTAGVVSIKHGAKGPNVATCTACSTSAHAIADATLYIRAGWADAIIAGGSEAVITELAIGGFAQMKALSTRNDDPTAASRPWDKERDGFVMGEGAGVLILEELEHAKARGAKIYAEVLGLGMTGDAYHISSPSEDGDGPARVMEMAIGDAGLDPSDIDYVNAHGTSTPAGDRIETLAAKRVFGAHADKVWLSSTKSMTGHLLGAAGSLELGFTAMALANGVIPPTINLDNPDPENDLDYVPHTAREKALRYALSNSFGFGGTNACVVLGAV